MISRKSILISTILFVLLACALLFYARSPDTVTFKDIRTADMETPRAYSYVEPVPGFAKRITKKPFGIYITPSTSPVQPERFAGYHTGADAEFGDTVDDVPVVAIADGIVMYLNWVSGYGGVIIVRHSVEDHLVNVLYGHLDADSILVSIGAEVEAGQQLGVLGEGFTRETDGERKHLHLSISTRTDVDLRGYARSLSELSSWVDPLSLFQN